MFEPISLAGTPAYLVFGFASPFKNALAPTIQFSPTFANWCRTALSPILAP